MIIRFFKRLFVSVCLLVIVGFGYAEVNAGQRMENSDILSWIAQRFAKGKVPPFSFVYDGKHSAGFIHSWKFASEPMESELPDVVRYRFTYSGVRSGLEVVCEVDAYIDFDAVKWVLYFTNTGTGDSKPLSEVKAIDLDFKSVEGGDFLLHSADGNHISRADFHPRTRVLQVGDTVQVSPINGRSSEVAFPFFNIELPANRGVMFSIGWSGSWVADFERKDSRTLTVASGMKRFESYLKGGETVRTPSMSLLFWDGSDRMVGQNKFRRFVLAHQTRKIDGQFAPYPLSSGFNYRDPEPCTEYSCLTADYAIAMIRRYTQFGLVPEVYWLDAGWNTGAADFENGKSWANTVGNWTVDTTRFPQGLKPIADEVHKLGAKFMVWFEPERVIRGTQWAVEHPEWMLDLPDSDEATYLMFDLGNEDARIWMSETIAQLIRENGIDYYRQDFNMFPDLYWEANDEPGRTGMKEVRHIEGLYAFWDYLLAAFPNLLIDNCASGGKRIDLETIARSAPLWRSDYYHYDDPDGYQGHTYGLNYFLPLHGTGILQTDPYSFRSSVSSSLIYNWKITDKGTSIHEMQRCLKEYAQIRPYFYEDYYPLSRDVDDLTKDDIWLAYQLHRPSDNTGIVVAFRRKDATDGAKPVQLGGLMPSAVYTIRNLDDDTVVTKTGKELMDGFALQIDEPRGSLLLHYTQR